ncbi:hypothetical protein IE81DRAFT_215263 [Ceraceosorus guamensis]|uniref:Pentacotripeptide-repeat region of PRORP domain-containing protein n=1 Tax=Ceraceosorus guamensis TaxID=1522189 RepID=A0A316VST4_9BASI|nr:hypothetical protein IE81DRAFT_215263 [Ceraceosorus guamensis]PWN40647.1 hypothetical protein IE81DRAFT_215263 [Ceraceosorus guamensis]
MPLTASSHPAYRSAARCFAQALDQAVTLHSAAGPRSFGGARCPAGNPAGSSLPPSFLCPVLETRCHSVRRKFSRGSDPLNSLRTFSTTRRAPDHAQHALEAIQEDQSMAGVTASTSKVTLSTDSSEGRPVVEPEEWDSEEVKHFMELERRLWVGPRETTLRFPQYKFNTYSPSPLLRDRKGKGPSERRASTPVGEEIDWAGTQAWMTPQQGGPFSRHLPTGLLTQSSATELPLDVTRISLSRALRHLSHAAQAIRSNFLDSYAANRRMDHAGQSELLWEAFGLALCRNKRAFSLRGRPHAGTSASTASRATTSELVTKLSTEDVLAAHECAAWLLRLSLAIGESPIPRFVRVISILGAPPLAGIHPLIADVGVAGDAQVVRELVNLCIQSHGGRADEWLLYAQARSMASRASNGFDWGRLERYWQSYTSYKRPPEPFGQLPMGEGGSWTEALSPPRYLFEFLLRFQLGMRNLGEARRIVHAMRAHGHSVDVGTWLILIRAHPALRDTLTALATAAPLRQRAQKWRGPRETGQPKPMEDASLEYYSEPRRILNDLVRIRCAQGDIRGTLLVLRVFGAPTGSQAPLAHAGGPRPNVATYAPVAELLGRGLAKPDLAMRFLGLALKHAEEPLSDRHDGKQHFDTFWILCALNAVLKALIYVGRPGDALRCADYLFTDGQGDHVDSARHQSQEWASRDGGAALERMRLKVRPNTTIFGTLMEAAASMPVSDRVPSTRAVLSLMFCSMQRSSTTSINPSRKGFPSSARIALARLMITTAEAAMPDQDRLATSFLQAPLSQPRRSRRRSHSQRITADAAMPDQDRLATSFLQVPLSQPRRFRGRLHSQRTERGILARLRMFKRRLAFLGFWEKQKLQTSSSRRPPRRSQDRREVESGSELGQDTPPEKLSPGAWARRLRVLAVVDKNFDEAMNFVKDLPRAGVNVNILHISPLVEGLVASGLLMDASEVTQRAAEHFGTGPTLRLHTAIIRGQIEHDDWTGVERQLEVMKQSGLEADAALITMIALARERVAREAHPVLLREPAMVERANRTLFGASGEAPHTIAVTSHFLMLLQRRLYLGAQLLVERAMKSGTRRDAVLRGAVFRSGNRMRKDLVKLEKAAGPIPDHLIPASAASAPAEASTSTDGTPRSQARRLRINAPIREELRQALEVQQRNQKRLSLLSDTPDKRHREEWHAFRRDTMRLVMDTLILRDPSLPSTWKNVGKMLHTPTGFLPFDRRRNTRRAWARTSSAVQDPQTEAKAPSSHLSTGDVHV